MNRRDLNRILMIGTALAGGWPAWLRRAFGAESGPACSLPTGQEAALRWRRIVSAAYRRAQQAGKPLLAFVVPAIDDRDPTAGYEAMWQRGRAFGELLNHGDDEALATLALAEIVCAPMSALRALAPSLGQGEPLMVLIESHGVPAAVRALDVALPPDLVEEGVILPEWLRSPPDWETMLEHRRRIDDQIVHRRIAALSQLLHQGLRATPHMLMERAAQAQGRLDDRGPGATGMPDDAGPAHLHRVSAILLVSAVGLPERLRQPAVQRIADAARFVLCRRQVPGSRWSVGRGAHLPEKSRRFLDFLGGDPSGRMPS